MFNFWVQSYGVFSIPPIPLPCHFIYQTFGILAFFRFFRLFLRGFTPLIRTFVSQILTSMSIQVTYRWTNRLSMRIVKNGDVHVSAPIGMSKKQIEDLRATTAANRLLQSVATFNKGSNQRGAKTTQGIDRADGRTACEGDGRNPVQHPL